MLIEGNHITVSKCTVGPKKIDMSDLEQQQRIKDHHFVMKKELVAEGSGTSSIHHEDHNITEIVAEEDYIHFGNEKYRLEEMMEAFGGTLNPGLAPPPMHNLANPATIGIIGISSLHLCFVDQLPC